MKIFIIHHSGLLGGGTLSCFDIMDALNEISHDIYLLLPPGDNDARIIAKKKKFNILDNGIKPVTFSYYNGGNGVIKSIIKYVFQLKEKNKWNQFLKDEKPDLVILNSITQWPLITILKKLKIKTICFVRETKRGSLKLPINLLIKSNLNKLDGISYISKFDMEEWGIKKSVKQIVIYDGINTRDTKKDIANENERLPRNEFNLLYLGGISKLKGIKILIKAMNIIKNENVKLYVLGDLGEKILQSKKIRFIGQKMFIKYIYKYIEKNELSSKIIFVGKKIDTNKWYKSSDLVVFPATKAHQARPIFEAGINNKSIIVSDFKNYNEFLIDNYNGVTFKHNSPRNLADIIMRLYEDEEVIKELEKNNYHKAFNEHNNFFLAKKIRKYITDILYDK